MVSLPALGSGVRGSGWREAAVVVAADKERNKREERPCRGLISAAAGRLGALWPGARQSITRGDPAVLIAALETDLLTPEETHARALMAVGATRSRCLWSGDTRVERATPLR